MDKNSKASAAALAAVQAGEAQLDTRVIARRAIELEKGVWSALEEIAAAEDMTLTQLVQPIALKHGMHTPAALRSFALAYFQRRSAS